MIRSNCIEWVRAKVKEISKRQTFFPLQVLTLNVQTKDSKVISAALKETKAAI
jgi:hypothetical protein